MSCDGCQGPPPPWLFDGAAIRLAPASGRAEPRAVRVESMQWPFLVYIAGEPGAVHPARCLPPLVPGSP